MWIAVLIVIAAILIVIAIGRNNAKKLQANIDNGIMINRDSSFYEYEETYLLKGDWNTVWGTLREANYHGAISSGKRVPGKCAVDYRGSDYTARFFQAEFDTEDCQTFRFRFTHWEEHRGTPYSEWAMNILLTTIEKTLLQIDPNTRYSIRKLDFKTRSSLF